MPHLCGDGVVVLQYGAVSQIATLGLHDPSIANPKTPIIGLTDGTNPEAPTY
jgi:hypothetical protein